MYINHVKFAGNGFNGFPWKLKSVFIMATGAVVEVEPDQK